jgi:Bifunctional DNA primase/polymerase, N-terminal
VSEDRHALLERYGRCYGDLHLAIAFTRSLRVDDDDFKTAINWQTRPTKLANGDHGAGLLVEGGKKRNPVVCLHASGLLGVDIDGEAGRALVRELVPDGLPPTVAVRSGRPDGGLHLWYRPLVGAAKVKIQFAAKVTLSADGYFVCPPAWHAVGRTHYEFLEGCSPWEREIAVFPASLLARLTARDRADDEAARADDSSPLHPNDRYPHLRRIAGAMRRAGAGEPAILAALLSENGRRCDPPKTEAQVRSLARDIATRYPPGARTR